MCLSLWPSRILPPQGIRPALALNVKSLPPRGWVLGAFPGLGAAPARAQRKGGTQGRLCPGLARRRLHNPTRTPLWTGEQRGCFPQTHRPEQAAAGPVGTSGILGIGADYLRNGERAFHGQPPAFGFPHFQASTQRTLLVHKARALLSYRKHMTEAKPEQAPEAHPARPRMLLGQPWARGWASGRPAHPPPEFKSKRRLHNRRAN